MYFPDYSRTGLVYHVVSLNDLAKVRLRGIRYDDKSTYQEKYREFHIFLNRFKAGRVDWKVAVHTSMNFKRPRLPLPQHAAGL